MSDFAYPLHEECGVFGIYDRAGTEDVAAAAYSALYALQHRGQESCGIAVNDDGVIEGHRDLGLVNEVFTPALFHLMQKEGGISEHDMFNTFNMGVGMVLTVPAEQADKALDILHANGEPEAYRLGVIAEGEGVELC